MHGYSARYNLTPMSNTSQKEDQILKTEFQNFQNTDFYMFPNTFATIVLTLGTTYRISLWLFGTKNIILVL